ncbi:hypothetical protein ACVME9_009255 [Bradyrhizobium liaoningense]
MRIKCTMQVWTIALGKTLLIASGKPFRPSTTAIRMRIPIYSGRVFRLEAGHRSDLKPATIPK